MNKLLKGAVAGAAGIALLLGGAGTFAAWNDSQAIGLKNTPIKTGVMSVANDTTATAGWFDVTKSATGTAISDETGYLMVPGSEIEYRQPITVTATGDQLDATVAFDSPELTNKGAADGNFTVTTKLLDASNAVVTAVAPGAHSYTAVVDVTFLGATTDTTDQNATLVLPQSFVTLEQTVPSTK